MMTVMLLLSVVVVTTIVRWGHAVRRWVMLTQVFGCGWHMLGWCSGQRWVWSHAMAVEVTMVMTMLSLSSTALAITLGVHTVSS